MALEKINPVEIKNQLQNGGLRAQELGSKKEEPAADDETIAKFWAYMCQLFGHAFISNHGTSPSEVWLDEMEKLTRTELRLGVEVIKELGQEFPPSLPAFMSYCKNGKPKGKHDVEKRAEAPWVADMPRLGAVKAQASVKAKAIAEMRKKLRMSD